MPGMPAPQHMGGPWMNPMQPQSDGPGMPPPRGAGGQMMPGAPGGGGGGMPQFGPQMGGPMTPMSPLQQGKDLIRELQMKLVNLQATGGNPQQIAQLQQQLQWAQQDQQAAMYKAAMKSRGAGPMGVNGAGGGYGRPDPMQYFMMMYGM